MRLLHLSDLHLGYRQYQRLTPGGMNQREADVAGTFRRAIDLAIERRPDLVLIGGDIFHHVRPANPAILAAFRQFTRLVVALPDVRVVMVAGNHDAPRTSETGCILRLFGELDRVTVVDADAQRVVLPELDLSILAVPAVPAAREREISPDPGARYNVLLLHAEIEGMLPRYLRSGERAALEIPVERIAPERWSYVALGHYHVYRPMAPNMFYSGALDYTSSNFWGELAEEREAGLPGKGMIEYDLATSTHRFHHLPATRSVVDLPQLAVRGMAAAEIDRAIRTAVDACPGGIDDAVVRLLVRDVPRHIARDLDHRALREYRRRALHFHLDTRRPDIVRVSAQGSPGKRASLADTVRDQLRSRLVESDINRDALVELGLHYLAEAERVPEGAGLALDGAGG